MKVSRIASGFGALALAGIGWLYAAPSALGGQVRAYTIAGASMEPGFHAGDLALVRPRATYAPGDIVAYRSASVDAVLLHRIVSIEAGVVTLRGDANGDDDIDRPTLDDLIGESVMRVPAGGRIARTLASPMVAAALLGSALLRASRRSRRGKHRQEAIRLRNPVFADPMRLRLITHSLAAGAAACSILAASLWFGDEAVAPTQLSFQHQGAFSYEADSPRSVYPEGLARTGDAVFISVSDTLRVMFTYGFASDVEHTTEGQISLRATISDGHGWSREIPLVPETSFEGATARVDGTLDLDKIERIRARMAAETGVQRIVYRIDIQPAVVLNGTLGTVALQETFAPSVALEDDGTVVRYVPAVDATADPLAPIRSGTLAGPSLPIARTMQIAGRSINAEVAAMVLIGLAFTLAALWRWLSRAGLTLDSRTDSQRIQDRFASRIVAVESIFGIEAVAIASADAFIRLVDTNDDPIFVATDASGSTWTFEHGSARYTFRDGPLNLEVPSLSSVVLTGVTGGW